MSTSDELHSRTAPVNEDMALQRKVWRFERAGWYALVVIMVLALAGLFADGPLSTRHIRSADGRLDLRYERFSRNGATESMLLRVRGGADSTVEVLLGGSLLSGLNIETLHPQPLRSASQGKALLLQLRTDHQGMATLYLTLRSNNTGSYRGHVRIGPNSALDFRKFIYP